MKIRNLTPHPITLLGRLNGAEKDSVLLEFSPSGILARIEEKTGQNGAVSVDGLFVPLIFSQFGEITGLPAPEVGVLFLVSLPVFSSAVATGRKDVLAVGEAVRDSQGRTIGCRSLKAPEGWEGLTD